MPSALEITKRHLTRTTDRIYSLPVLVLLPHSRCNCRCLMCDIWRANRNAEEITAEQLAPHIDAIRKLNVQQVVLSGGEALMHRNLWALCAMLRPLDVKITLLSTGILLKKYAAEVVQWADEVIVSLDGSPTVHDAIRRVPNAYDKLAAGIAAVRDHNPAFRITARCVLQKENFRDLAHIIDTAHVLNLNQISFLPADTSSEAFNRPGAWDDERVADVSLSREQIAEFSAILNGVIATHADDFAGGFIAESPAKLRRIPHYYAAVNRDGAYPLVQCNAPWVSAVVEADGTVRPCFFHKSLGNINDAPLDALLNAPQAVQFRRGLDVASNPTCQKCVCSLSLGRRTDV